jgi:hypothetical protein
MEYWTAFLIGLLGSLHCVGMCGPIAFALPMRRDRFSNVIIGSLLYNSGRLFTYFIIGCLFGLMGKGFAIAGFQQSLSIAVGIGMILSIIIPSIYTNKMHSFPTFNNWLGKVKGSLGKRLGRTSNFNLWSIGILNGLLPCGLVYMGVAGSLAMATPFDGGLFMMAFGAGTLPLMLSVSLLGNRLQFSFRNKVKKVIPLFVLAIGILFIIRGLNLDIPYLSPKIDKEAQFIECH